MPPVWPGLALLALLAAAAALAWAWRERRRRRLASRELAHLQTTLRDYDERFRGVFFESPVGMAICDPHGRILQVNRLLCQLTGQRPNELTGRPFADLIHVDDRPQLPAAPPPHGSHRTECRLHREGAPSLWVTLTSAVTEDARGRTAYLLRVVEDISGQHAAREAAAQSERRFRALIERSSDSITLVDRNGRILFDAGPLELRHLGHAPEEFLGRSALDFLHPDDRPEAARLLEVVAQTPLTTASATLRAQHKNGPWICFDATATNLLEEPGVEAIVINARDVTERRRAEERLRESEARFSKAFHGSPIPISIATLAEGRFIDVNDSFLELTGYRRDELIGHTSQEVGLWPTPEDRDAFTRRLVADGAVRDLASRFRTKSGVVRESVAYAEIIRLGNEECILCLGRDVTEERRAAAAARKSEERFQLLARATNDIIWDWDLRSNTLWWNEGIRNLLGYDPGQAEGDASWWDQHIHPDDRERVLGSMQQVIRERGSHWSAEYRYRRSDGGYADVFDRAYLLLDDQGEPVRMIGAMMDISGRKAAERDLAQARDAALESARLKSEFLANISHEVRTPLNGIIGMTVLLQDTPLSAEQGRFAENIQSSAETLLTIINDILDFSKIEAGKLQFETLDFDLRATLDNTIEMLAERAQRKKIELVSQISTDVPLALRGDPGRLRQVITNLLVNAIKFTEEGRVQLSVRREQETDTHASLCFTVRDTGIGIPPDALPHLFQAFYQVDGSTARKYGGTGLGLAICKQLVELMSGQIGVESTPGEGSVFWFTVRLQKQSGLPRPPLAPTGSLSGQRALVAEPDPTHRAALLAQLAQLGIAATPVHSRAEVEACLHEAHQQETPFAFLILDFALAGPETAAWIRSLQDDPRLDQTGILALCAHAPGGDTALLRAAALGSFLTRPVTPVTLATALAGLTAASRKHETRIWLNRRPQATPAAPLRLEADRPVHILVAEDNPINQRVAIGLLEKLGYRAEAVANGREVLNSMDLVNYDIVLMDCQLPELDGYRTTEEIRRREAIKAVRRPVQIIAMTAHAMPGSREKCLASGMNDFLTKPVQIDVLNRAITKAIGQLREPEDTPLPFPPQSLDRTALEVLRSLRQPNRPDPVAELIQLYLTETPATLAAMQRAAARYDGPQLELLAHSLRGASRGVGASDIADLCADLEEKARAGSLQVAAFLLRRLEGEFARTRPALEQEIAH